MPDNTLTEAIREAYAYADDAAVILDTVEIYHPAFSEPIRVVADRADLIATLEDDAPRNAGEAVTFRAFAFRCSDPGVDDQGRPRFTLELDNVSREIIQWVQAASESTMPVEIIPRRYLDVDLTGPQNTRPWRLIARAVRADATTVSCEAQLVTFNPDKTFPSAVYTTDAFPGLI